MKNTKKELSDQPSENGMADTTDYKQNSHSYLLSGQDISSFLQNRVTNSRKVGAWGMNHG